jgi:hypothetical protein
MQMNTLQFSGPPRLELIDDYTLEQTDNGDGKVSGVSRWTISRDGKSMKVVVSGTKRGQTMTYTAIRLPSAWQSQLTPAVGRVTVNTAPPSVAFAASTLPLCSFITDLQMLSPSPVPRPGRFVV